MSVETVGIEEPITYGGYEEIFCVYITMMKVMVAVLRTTGWFNFNR